MSRSRIRTLAARAVIKLFVFVNILRRRINGITGNNPFRIGFFTGIVAWVFIPMLYAALRRVGIEWTQTWVWGSVFITYAAGYFLLIVPKFHDDWLLANASYGMMHLVMITFGANLPFWPAELRKGFNEITFPLIVGIGGSFIAIDVIRTAIREIRKRWGEAIRHRIEAIGEWLVDTAEFVRAEYVQLRQVYTPTQLWLLAHLLMLMLVTVARPVNQVFRLEIPVRNLFMAFAVLMALEAGISIYLMRNWMRRSLLFAAAAAIVLFKPWENLAVMRTLGYSSIVSTLIVQLWCPDKILKRIRRELGLPFEEDELLAKLKTRRGFLLILAGVLVHIAQWVTEFVQDWYLQVNVKQLILMPFNLIAVMGVALLLQYPQYPPLEEFAPKAVGLTRVLMLYWTAFWTFRWILQAYRRFMSIMSYGREAGYSGNVLGGLVTISAIVTLGLSIMSIGYRYVPTVVGEGTAWLYAEALPYFETVGNFAARIISALV